MSKWLTINDLAWWTRGLLPHQPGGLARNRRQGRRVARAGRGGRGLRTGRPPTPRVRGTPPGPPGRGVQTRGARRRTRQHDVATIELHHGETPRAGTSRQEIQAGRESSARQMAEIRRFIFDLFSEDDNEEDTRKWSNLAPYYMVVPTPCLAPFAVRILVFWGQNSCGSTAVTSLSGCAIPRLRWRSLPEAHAGASAPSSRLRPASRSGFHSWIRRRVCLPSSWSFGR